MSRCIERVRSHPARPRTHGLASLHSNAGLTHDAGAGGFSGGGLVLDATDGVVLDRLGYPLFLERSAPAKRTRQAGSRPSVRLELARRASRRPPFARSLARAAIRAGGARMRQAQQNRDAGQVRAGAVRSRRRCSRCSGCWVTARDASVPGRLLALPFRSRRRSAACGHRANAGARVVLSRGWPCVR